MVGVIEQRTKMTLCNGWADELRNIWLLQDFQCTAQELFQKNQRFSLMLGRSRSCNF